MIKYIDEFVKEVNHGKLAHPQKKGFISAR